MPDCILEHSSFGPGFRFLLLHLCVGWLVDGGQRIARPTGYRNRDSA